jgi:hypothetical protein
VQAGVRLEAEHEQRRRSLAGLAGKVDRYDMIAPHVYFAGDTAILTYRLVSPRPRPDDTTHWIDGGLPPN